MGKSVIEEDVINPEFAIGIPASITPGKKGCFTSLKSP
jgi:hypothetical protein